MNLRRTIIAVAALAAMTAPAAAQTATSYALTDSAGHQFNVKAWQCSTFLCPSSVPIDYNGNPLTGVAGSPSVQAMTIQGISGGQAVPMSAASLPLPAGAATAANQTSSFGTVAPGSQAANSALAGAVYNTSAPTMANGQQAALQLDGAANLDVNVQISALPTGAATSANQAAAQGSPSGGTAATKSELAGGIYNSSPLSLTTGQQASLQLDSAGNVAVNVKTGSVTPVPSSAAAAGLSTGACTTLCSNLVVKNSPGNLYSFNVSAHSTLSGAALVVNDF